jgi:lipoate-protein ligase A
MKYLDRTWPAPSADLAVDEALLDACEDGTVPGGVLRVYEPRETCVVVGYGNRRGVEVDLAACGAASVPVLRRASGGGTVVLGPGCLAYAVVLPVAAHPGLETVTGTNRWVMERQRAVMERVLGEPVVVCGHTDLVAGGRKFSGNAQRRRSRALLFHGTFLLEFDLGVISRLLRMPSWQPEYRGGRLHDAFVRNLGVGAGRVKEALREAWGAEQPWEEPLEGRVEALLAARYGRPEWHARF